jgi:protein-S-isoprenylcysteine O-methyltransferase Ste14
LTLLLGSFYFDLLSILGIAVVLFGLYLHLRSRKELGKFCTSIPTIFKDHKLITTGPYSFVRHPAYLASFIVMIGFILISKSFVSLIFAFVIAMPFGFYKISVEEKMLQEKFGKKFEKYKKEVPLIIPKIIIPKIY